MGNPCAYVNIRLEIKPGTKKKSVRNKAIPSRAREPAALSIYAPLRRFQLDEDLWRMCSRYTLSYIGDCIDVLKRPKYYVLYIGQHLKVETAIGLYLKRKRRKKEEEDKRHRVYMSFLNFFFFFFFFFSIPA